MSKRNKLPLPTAEEIFANLNGGHIFFKLDLSEAYLQIPVEEKCAELLTINTHRGLYKINRLQYGIKVAPTIFQKIMDTMLADLDFATAYLDDILIKSKNRDHAELVIEGFKKIKEFGFKLSMEKCEFFLSKIKYLGQVIDKKGRTPDPNRVDAIKYRPALTNVAALQSFLGLANYYNSYIPNMHILRAPLNHLLKIDVKWNWTDECKKKRLRNKNCTNIKLSFNTLQP